MASRRDQGWGAVGPKTGGGGSSVFFFGGVEARVCLLILFGDVLCVVLMLKSQINFGLKGIRFPLFLKRLSDWRDNQQSYYF